MRRIASRAFAALTLTLLWLAPAHADAAKPFVSGSLTEITAARAGRPFILALWSLTCAHCQEELALLGRLLAAHPALDLVLVSTDSPQEAAEIGATLARHALERAESWVFADDFAEKLRFQIDRKWRGELPRTYFYAADHSRRGVSGRVAPEEIEAWLKEQERAASHPRPPH